MIRRVEKEKIIISKNDPDLHLNNFINLYLMTMKKNKAEKFYNFNSSYFKKLFKLIQNDGFLITASKENEVLGIAVFLKSKVNSHYHLSATNNELNVPGITNAMIFPRNCSLDWIERELPRINKTPDIPKTIEISSDEVNFKH